MNRRKMRFLLAGRVLTAGALALPCVSLAQAGAPGLSAQADRPQTHAFDIPAQPLAQAVLAFARQAGVDLYVNDIDLSAYTSVALKGSFSTEGGLTRLLGNSPVGYRYRQAAGEVRPNVQLVGNGSGVRERVYSMAPVEVRGDGVNERVYQAPRAVSIITREEMDRVPVRHAAELIQDTPGVASAVNRQNPGLSINIRGMQDFGRVNMMIDGMRQDFVQNGHMQRNGEMYVDSELLSEAVVERGVVRGVHGTGALAGSVDFRTLDFGDVLREGRDIGLRLHGSSGVGHAGNGINFLGSLAGAARAGEHLQVLAALSRRSVGDYRIGTRGGAQGQNEIWTVKGNGGAGFGKTKFNDVKFAGQAQDSSLFKARWQLNDASSLLMSYVGTQVDYSYTTDANSLLQEGGTPWRKMGTSNAQTSSFALDYKLKPADKPWLDLNVKLYTVDTRVKNYSNPTYPLFLDMGFWADRINDVAKIRENIDTEYWNTEGTGTCERNGKKSQYALNLCTQYGIGRLGRLKTKTDGFQLDNTSRFTLGDKTLLSANYGVEYYRDRTRSDRSWDHVGRSVRPIGLDGQDALNPAGRRSMGSLFAELKLEDDFYTVAASLRYERYQAKGKTQTPGRKSVEVTTMERAEEYLCSQYKSTHGDIVSQQAYIESCRLARAGNQAALEAFWDTNPSWESEYQAVKFDRKTRKYVKYGPVTIKTEHFHPVGYTLSQYYPSLWLDDEPALYDYDVDRSAGKWLPALSAAIRPARWLEAYGSWGKSWRPPALNELLMVGEHPGDNFATILSNPYLDSETSRTWETGVNTLFERVATDNDNLSFKLGYFDTRVDNYLVSSMNVLRPGDNMETLPLPGTTAFVNNRHGTRFRGLELEGRYDAGLVYGGVSYTHYLGGANKFCEDLYPLGSGINAFDHPKADGSYRSEHDEKIAQGYDSWRAWADDQVVCANFVFNSAIAKPVDKGMVQVGMRLLERKLDTGVRFNYSGDGWYNRDDNGSQVWFKYTTWDWYASYQASDQVKLMASLQNLTNRMYVDGYSDAMARTFAPGRALTVGAEVRF